ncbi:ABC-F family ATP-binding cassette domain-containing protein [Fodinicola acaciae]|uniref:ABC-F family ATP-binding cassette domain-containing protein n=1 Tax=Fodinicola acaciae TaxID=2681555 RepID=UPI0013D4A652|nr:ABC-F family ATP-binding cassette domain-containing protein [Fodinicola acaciae]
MFSLIASDLVKVYGDRRVLDGVSLTASPGQRLGLVGENGVGKSTLLRLLAGQESADSGTVTRPPDHGFLAQELPYDPAATLASVIDDALAEIRAAQEKLDQLTARLGDHPELLDEYGEALEWAQAHELWDADRRAELVLAGLGVGELGADRRLDQMSGGQRARVGMAALLIRQPRALLLDEPTNHLDDDALAFLEKQLSQLPGVVVLASHDRVFLDAVCTDIVDLDPARGGPQRYGGTYTDYLAEKRAERQRWQEQYEAEQDELKQLRHAVNVTARQVSHNRPMGNTSKLQYDFKGGRVQKQVSRRVRNAQQRLDELTRDQVRKPPAPLRFSATLTGKVRTELLGISLRDVRVDGRLQLDLLDVFSTTRLLVTGPNGSGKSTLLAVLADRLPVDAGVVRRAKGIRIGLLEQDVVFPDPSRTARSLYDQTSDEQSARLVGFGLVAPKDLDRPVGELSVGQRRRVALALLIARPPHILLLDEPTNHISLKLAEELEEALRAAPGAIVVATHDRWFRRGWDGEEIVLRST